MATQRNTNLIPAYKFKPILDLALPKDGDEGYNPETKTFIPFEAGDDKLCTSSCAKGILVIG
jgi:hypothetical protein